MRWWLARIPHQHTTRLADVAVACEDASDTVAARYTRFAVIDCIVERVHEKVFPECFPKDGVSVTLLTWWQLNQVHKKLLWAQRHRRNVLGDLPQQYCSADVALYAIGKRAGELLSVHWSTGNPPVQLGPLARFDLCEREVVSVARHLAAVLPWCVSVCKA